MSRRSKRRLCPYCGSLSTTRTADGETGSVYHCDACDRDFAGPLP